MRKLRSLANAFGYIIFGVAIYIAGALYFGHPMRLSAASWVWFWQMPGGVHTWTIPPSVAGVVGIFGIWSKRYHLAIISGVTCSAWSFVLGVILCAAVFTEEYANLIWFPMFWFLSASYSLLSLSFTQEYLNDEV